MTQDIFGNWRKALNAALARVDAGALSATEEVKEVDLSDGTTAIIYVKIIRYDAATMRLDPSSGGLLAAL